MKKKSIFVKHVAENARDAKSEIIVCLGQPFESIKDNRTIKHGCTWELNKTDEHKC